MLSTSLSSLRLMITDLVSVTTSASGSYPEAMVDRWTNESINQYEVERDRVAGGYRELRATVTTTSSTTPVQTYPGNEVVSLDSLSPLVKSVEAVWLLIDGYRHQLDKLAESDRGTPWLTWPLRTGRPTLYEVIELSDGAIALHFWPPASSAFTLEVIYHPQPTQLTNPGDLWLYEPGTIDAVVCDVAMRILERDDEADTQQYQNLAGRKGLAFRTLRRALGQRNRGVMQMRDTRAERYGSQRRWFR